MNRTDLGYIPDLPRADGQHGSGIVVFVDGPRNGEIAELEGPVTVIAVDGGVYRRSVRCADDRRLRYVFSPTVTTGASGDHLGPTQHRS